MHPNSAASRVRVSRSRALAVVLIAPASFRHVFTRSLFTVCGMLKPETSGKSQGTLKAPDKVMFAFLSLSEMPWVFLEHIHNNELEWTVYIFDLQMEQPTLAVRITAEPWWLKVTSLQAPGVNCEPPQWVAASSEACPQKCGSFRRSSAGWDMPAFWRYSKMMFGYSVKFVLFSQ